MMTYVRLSYQNMIAIMARDGFGPQAMDNGMNILNTWCDEHTKFFYIGQRVSGGFEFRFAEAQDAVLFKLTWGAL